MFSLRKDCCYIKFGKLAPSPNGAYDGESNTASEILESSFVAPPLEAPKSTAADYEKSIGNFTGYNVPFVASFVGVSLSQYSTV